MANQRHSFEDALRSGDRDLIFRELVNHPTQPLTDAELTKLVALRPERWGRYAEWIGRLDGRVADRKPAIVSGLDRRLA